MHIDSFLIFGVLKRSKKVYFLSPVSPCADSSNFYETENKLFIHSPPANLFLTVAIKIIQPPKQNATFNDNKKNNKIIILRLQ